MCKTNIVYLKNALQNLDYSAGIYMYILYIYRYIGIYRFKTRFKNRIAFEIHH